MSRPAQQRSELAEVLLSFRRAFLTVGSFSFFINLLMLTPAIYMLQIYDRALGSRNVTTLLMLTLITLGLFGLMSLLEWIRSMVLVRVGARLDLDINSRVFDATFERNLRQAGQNPAQALSDLASMRQTLTGAGLIALTDAPWMPIYVLVIYMLHVQLGIFALIGVLLLVILAVINERVSAGPLGEAQKLAMAANAQANNNLRNAEVIEAMGMLPAIRSRWFKLHQKFLMQQAVASDRAGVLNAITRFVRISMQSLALGYGALLAIEGEITPGMMIAGSIIIGRALAPVEVLIANWKQLVSARAAYGRLAELLQVYPARVAGMPLPRPEGVVLVENAATAAPGSRALILKNVSFSLKAGEVVAVIGPSASGKSTLARLLVGVWPPLAGSVRLDGAEVFKWNKDELGRHLGYLPQDIELFDGTVAENIARFGDLDSEKILAAAQAAGVHDLVLMLPMGYDTPLGDGGNALSGGQKQRIGLARALYGDPALIVLDEPNSNLDDQGEAALAETLRRLKAAKRTVVIITHRMSTLAVADSILVMHEGTVKLHGPRDQVLAALRAGNPTGAERQGGAARPAAVAVAANTPATPRFGA
ncbi:type I secretion system permease/ATPase [Accumulibacter sp.]|uniref:type I secretion system permease/ATPase n=1 Tax=Accumulibacter sp. TaxID=2053492 RepID=UPI0025E17A77|nr:type I secretion system permease/ATPase [Accumulibacter sp.]MCM8611237.1 type I secretion system permease/ATPase [Accumulibacter sp.]MCM8634685.1 type I secretion system permease/ATPase [Accumulibacter sp.]MCM8638772.1 type I secretion system permease/ATPase [Accumulibacter sp.]